MSTALFLASSTIPGKAILRSVLLPVLAGLLLFPAFGTAAEPARQGLRAMVLHPTGDYSYHANDLDFGLDKTGIPFRHYAQEDVDAILTDFRKYDLVMCTPLVNLNNIFGGHEREVRDWLEEGNALIVTDGCYANNYNPVLPAIATNGTVTTCPCYGCETIKQQFVRDLDPPHPLRNFPRQIDHEARQWLCLQADGGWETVATCTGPGPIHPVTVLHPVGKGFVYLSSMQQRWKGLPANLRANLALRRIGIVPLSYSLTPLVPGPGVLHLKMKNLGKAEPVMLRLKIDAGPAVPAAEFKGGVRPDKDGLLTMNLRFLIKKPGPVALTLEARTQKSPWTKVFSEKVEIAHNVTILPPRYRGILSTERRVPTVSFPVSKPGSGKQAGFRGATVSVFSPEGRLLGRGNFSSKSNVTEATVPVRLPKLPAGEGYKAKVQIRDSYGRMTGAATNFVVRAPGDHPGEVIIDEDGTLLVDGKPFFTLGLYHIHAADFAEAKAMGFNTVQAFQWQTRKKESLDAAQAAGVKLLFENNEKTAGGHRYLPGFLRDHPALLMWYAPDEPGHDPDQDLAETVYDIYRTGDPYHPVIYVHYNPPRYALGARAGDLFGAEHYLFNKNGETPYWKAIDLLDVAYDGMKGMKPVFAVPSAFGGETIEYESILAWLSMTHGVRGFLWYTWDENNGSTGLKYDTVLKEEMKGLLAEINELVPALVAPVRRSFVTEDGVHAMVCNDGKTMTYLMINMAKESRPVPAIDETKGANPKPLFEAPAADKPLAPHERRAYQWPARRIYR